jgi:RHS repeat-associated protein
LNSYTYDALDRLTRVDQTGQTGGNTVSEKRVDLAYNAIGQSTSIARYKDTDGGTAHEVAIAGYSYDTLGRLTGLAYTKGGTNLFTPYSWTYDSLSSSGMGFDGSATVRDPRVAATAAAAVFDALGRITQVVSQDGTSTYGYDSKSQLTSADHSYQSDEAYTFDSNGNRTMSGYQTGTDNRLTNDGTYSYTYDAEGNRLTRTKTATGEVTEYTWDYHNRLTQVTEKNSQGTVTQVVEYVYDVFNRRIGRKIDTSAPFDMANAVIERYVLDDIHNGLTSADGGNVVLDFVDPDGSGAQAIAMSKRYLYGEAVDQLFAQEDLSKTLNDTSRNLWPLVDHLGTVRDLAKQDGTIAAHYKYDSFGNVTSGDTSKTRYLFTSREFDAATKLQYNRARYYDAAVGRWISDDPLGFAAGDANVGRYVNNEGIDSFDPSGLWDIDDHRRQFPEVFRGREITHIRMIRSWWDDYDEAREKGYYEPGWYVWITAPIARMFLPRTEPSVEYTFEDGTKFVVIGGGPSSGDMVNQAMVISGVGQIARGVGKLVPGRVGGAPKPPTEAEVRAFREFTDEFRGIERQGRFPAPDEYFPPKPPSGYDGWIPPEDRYPGG